jgi:hypothetical protein
LLSFALRELYIRCARRNADRLLTERDYADMGRLCGALARRASDLLGELIAQDAAYEATARRVFLRMVTYEDGECFRQRVHRSELVFQQGAENQRVATLLARFREARLIRLDKDEWEPAHDWLLRGWSVLETWRVQFGARAFVQKAELAEASRRWHADQRSAQLWHHGEPLRAALRVMHAEDAWLNARERAFVTASIRRRRLGIGVALAGVALAAIGGLVVWDTYYRMHVSYYCDFVRRWGEPEGVEPLSAREARARASSVKLVRKGHGGHVLHVERVRCGEDLASTNTAGLSYHPELELGSSAEGGRMPCQWDFAYESDLNTVIVETVRDRAGRVLYRMQYRGEEKARRVAQFIDEKGRNSHIVGGNAELVEFVRSAEGFDTEKRFLTGDNEPARNQECVSVEIYGYNEMGYVDHIQYLDEKGNPTQNKDGVAEVRSKYEHGNRVELLYYDEAGRPTWDKNGISGWRSQFDEHGNETERAFFDQAGRPTRNTGGVAGWRSKFDEHGNQTERAFFDEIGEPTRSTRGIAGWHAKFDEHGNEREQAYFDQAGRPARDKYGVVVVRMKFDRQGRVSEQAYFDEAGRPARNKHGIASVRLKFDDQGNQIERAYFDEAGDPTELATGVAVVRSRYGERGELVGTTTLDKAGKVLQF